MFNLVIESTDKTCSIIRNEAKALAKKKLLTPWLKEIDTINNSDIYDTYKDLYWSEKECEEKLFQITTQKNAIKKIFGKRCAIPLDFDFFKYLVYLYELKEDLISKSWINFFRKGDFVKWTYCSNIQVFSHFFGIWCNIWHTLY